MNNKKHKITGIIVVVMIILLILIVPKIYALNDGGTKIYKSLTYEITKVHKIRADSLNGFDDGTIVKILGKEIYNDVPKDVEVIVDDKGKEETNQKYEKEIEDIILTLDIPNNWKYEELSQNTENDFYKYALKIYKTQEDKYAVLYFYHQPFGVCGTGRTSKKITLNNGNEAIIGYYDGNDVWEDISFYEMNKYVAILNYGLDKDEAEELLNFIKSINIKEASTNSETEYTFIGEIIEAYDNYIIVKPEQDSKEAKSADRISIGITRPTNGTNDFYVVGNKVKITYDGEIMESYPAQVKAKKIELKSAENFEILFYDKHPMESYKIYAILDKSETDKYDYTIYGYDGSVNIRIDGKDYSLKEALLENKITMEEIIAKANNDFPNAVSYDDGGSIEYHYENYTIIKCHTLDGNRDVYIGTKDLKLSDLNL